MLTPEEGREESVDAVQESPASSRQLARLSHSGWAPQTRGHTYWADSGSHLKGTKMLPQLVGAEQGAEGRFRASHMASEFRSYYLLALRGSQCSSRISVLFSFCAHSMVNKTTGIPGLISAAQPYHRGDSVDPTGSLSTRKINNADPVSKVVIFCSS